MSAIVPELILGLVGRRERRAAYPPGTAKKTALTVVFTVSVAWRPNETSHTGMKRVTSAECGISSKVFTPTPGAVGSGNRRFCN
jgi:hypothetical protein